MEDAERHPKTLLDFQLWRGVTTGHPHDRASSEHLAAWDWDQLMMALHEGGHVALAALLGIRIKEVDITDRSVGRTLLNTNDDLDTQWEGASDQFNRIVAMLGGRAAMQLVMGEPFNGAAKDIADATAAAIERVDAGLEPGVPMVSVFAFFGEATPSLIEARGAAVVAVLARAQKRAEELVDQHRAQVLELTKRIYLARRLSGPELDTALEESGLEMLDLASLRRVE